MSIIPKICNYGTNFISHLTAILTRNLQKATPIPERFYSKRFTLCNKCKKCPKPKKNCGQTFVCNTKKVVKKKKDEKGLELKPKKSKTVESLPKSSGKCIPFQQKKLVIVKAPKEKSKKCKASMKKPCADLDEVKAECSTKMIKTNDCGPAPGIKPCPKGDWERF